VLINFATGLAVMSLVDQMSSKVKNEHIEMFVLEEVDIYSLLISLAACLESLAY